MRRFSGQSVRCQPGGLEYDMEALTSARSSFATVDAAEEAQHDAQAYGAACDAALAFAARDQSRSTLAVSQLTTALDHRECAMIRRLSTIARHVADSTGTTSSMRSSRSVHHSDALFGTRLSAPRQQYFEHLRIEL
jgi:hypothetical protein